MYKWPRCVVVYDSPVKGLSNGFIVVIFLITDLREDFIFPIS